eukprot:gene24611-33079_t
MGDRQISFVLDTWLVPNAWMNPSMILDPLDQTKLIMVWRVPDSKKTDKVGYFWINSTTWKQIRQKDWIDRISPGKWRNPLVGEDSRIFNHNGQLWLVYNTHLTKFKQLQYASVHFNASENMFFILDPPMHATYEHEVNVRHQKNWSPFDFCPK